MVNSTEPSPSPSPSLVEPIEHTVIYKSLEEVTVGAGQEVLMEGHRNILLIVCDPQGILNQQLRSAAHCAN